MTNTKTCMQPLGGRMVRREHEAPANDEGGTRDGYSECIHCGQTVYVGQGYCSPQALQRLEAEASLADRRR
jgi:hypothetical protein